MELFPVAETLTSLAFSHENDAEQNQEWLIRRFRQMFNVVKDTPVYKEMVRDAREEALQEGLEKGREEGLKEGLEKARSEIEKAQQEKLEALRQILVGIVRARFPRLEKVARGQAAITEDEDEINDLIIKMSTAQSIEEAKRDLLGDEI